MRIHFGCLTLVVGLWLAAPSPAHAQDIEPAFRADIVKLMDLLGTSKLARQLSGLVAQQMLQVLKTQQPDIPPRIIEIVQQVSEEERAKLFEGPDNLIGQLVPVYAKYYTHDDIKGLIAFYESDLGRKAISVMPSLVQESMSISQKAAVEMAPRVRQAIEQRLKAEGLDYPLK